MKLPAALLFLTTILGGCATPPDALPVDDTPAGRLQGLSFMTGTWRGKSPKGIWEAQYTRPDGGMMLGTSKEFIDGRARAFEFELFHVEGDTPIVRPFPNGRRSVAFKLTALDRTARKATFENPAHDFPQRIVYWRSADGILTISVDNPGESGFELVLLRVD